MRMSRTLSVTRAPIRHGKGAADESREFGALMAHAPTAVSRPGNRAIRFALDAAACPERLLGHAAGPCRSARISRYVQCRPGAGHTTRGVRQRQIQRALVRADVQTQRGADPRRQARDPRTRFATQPPAPDVALAALCRAV